MGVDDPDESVVVEVVGEETNVVSITDDSRVVEVVSDNLDLADIQTTSHIIEVVRHRINPVETEGHGITVDVVESGGGSIDSEAIAAIVRLVYVANEIPGGQMDGQNRTFTTADPYKPQSTRLFVNGLRQSTPFNYTEDGGNQITLSFVPDKNDLLLIDYIKLT